MTPFPRLTYDEAMTHYNTDKPVCDPTRAATCFAWVIDFPLFKWVAEERRWDSEHHPFTSPKPEFLARLEADLAPCVPRAMTWSGNGNWVRVPSASTNVSFSSACSELLGYTEEAAEAEFRSPDGGFQYGAPPHGGIALGIDRLVAILAGTDTIRDVIAFPKTRQASDLTMRAPSPVAKSPVGPELHIRVK